MSLFTIFNKTSASPTIIIKTIKTGTPIVLKLWSKDANSSYSIDEHKMAIAALEYERYIYANTVNPYLINHPNAPFMKYVGEGVFVNYKQLADFIGAQTDEENEFLAFVLVSYLSRPRRGLDYYKNFDKSFKYSDSKALSNATFSAILLPYVDYNTFNDFLTNGPFDQTFELLTTIIKGIYIMYYDMKLLHNDLHGNNVLIEKGTGKVMIYDYDRSSVNGILNPYCDNKVDNYTCSQYDGRGYTNDFYRILLYCDQSSDFKSMLINLAKPEKVDWIKANFARIIHYLENQPGGGELEPSEKTDNFINLFGPINEVYNRIKTMKQSGIKPIEVTEEKGEFGFSADTATHHHRQLKTEDLSKHSLSKPQIKPRSGKFPRPRNIVAIMQENDLRKFGPAK